MNYLDHILLSGNNKEIQLGNFIGDAVKGKNYQNYPISIRKGLLLHRQIDSFTDVNKIVHQSKKRLHPRYGHYSGVIIDVLYDHFLCVNWNTYSNEPLESFIVNFYENLLNNKVSVPDEIKIIIPKLTTKDWFSSYKTIEGIGRVLKGMEDIIKHDIPLSMGVFDLEDNFDLLNNDFNEFFPKLKEHSKKILKTLHQHYGDK